MTVLFNRTRPRRGTARHPATPIGPRRRDPRMAQHAFGSRRRTAFTLIELLVVVAILSLLMSILLPSLKNAKRRAKETLCTTNLRSIYLAQTLFLQDHRKFQALNNAEPPESDGTWQYNYLIFDGGSSTGGGTRKFNFGPLTSNKQLLHEIKLVYCPLQTDPSHSLDTDVNPWPPNDFFDTRAGYSRRHLLTYHSLTDFKKQIAIFADLMHMPEKIKTAHKRGVNAAFIDGHVTWVSDPGIMTNNPLGAPFTILDNPIVEDIWETIDKHP